MPSSAKRKEARTAKVKTEQAKLATSVAAKPLLSTAAKGNVNPDAKTQPNSPVTEDANDTLTYLNATELAKFMAAIPNKELVMGSEQTKVQNDQKSNRATNDDTASVVALTAGELVLLRQNAANIFSQAVAEIAKKATEKDLAIAQEKFDAALKFLQRIPHNQRNSGDDYTIECAQSQIHALQEIIAASENKISEADAKVRDRAGFKKLDADNAFKKPEYKDAAQYYEEALALFISIKYKLPKDDSNITRCQLNLKICLEKVQQQEQAFTAAKAAAQYGFFAIRDSEFCNEAQKKFDELIANNTFGTYLEELRDRSVLPIEKELRCLSETDYIIRLNLLG